MEKVILSRNKVGEILFSDSKAYCKIVVIKVRGIGINKK